MKLEYFINGIVSCTYIVECVKIILLNLLTLPFIEATCFLDMNNASHI